MPLDPDHRQGGCVNPPWATIRDESSVLRKRAVILNVKSRWLPDGTLRRRAGPRPAAWASASSAIISGQVAGPALDRIWVHPALSLHPVLAHATPASRIASNHLPVVADIDAA